MNTKGGEIVKYCSYCGKELSDDASFCLNCGKPVVSAGIPNSYYSPAPSHDPNDAPNGGWALIGFLIPIAGLILYCCNNDRTPLRAASAGKGALAGFLSV